MKALRCISHLLMGLVAVCSLTVSGRAQDAVAYQLDLAHSGQTSVAGIKGELKPVWTQTLSGVISHPLIVNGFVYVAAVSGAGMELCALDQSSGNIVGQAGIAGVIPWSSAAYDNGQEELSDSGNVPHAAHQNAGTFNPFIEKAASECRRLYALQNSSMN
jgi:hypothetical protein